MKCTQYMIMSVVRSRRDNNRSQFLLRRHRKGGRGVMV